MAKDLTIRQEKFVAAYLVSGNATRAAIEAGYSAKSAAPQGHQLLNNPKVKAMLALKSGEILNRYNVSAERVLEEIARIAFFDPGNLFNVDGILKDIKDLDKDTLAALTAFDVAEWCVSSREGEMTTSRRATKVKWANKLKALELLARHFKLLTDRVEHSGGGLTLEQLVCGSYEISDGEK